MMKKPEEIRLGLFMCTNDGECKLCPYYQYKCIQHKCIDALLSDTSEYIVNLETMIQTHDSKEGG